MVEHWSPKPGVGSSSLSFRAKSTCKMKLVQSIKESYNELVHKVTWPTANELVNSAVAVLIASLIIALIVWLMDVSFEALMKFIYGLF